MEQKDVIRIEDEIQFAFENFSKYGEAEQNQLIKLVIAKFKIEEMQFVLRKPVTISLADHSLKYNNPTGLAAAFTYASATHSNQLSYTVQGLLNNSLFGTYLKEHITVDDVIILTKFAKVQNYTAAQSHNNHWQFTLAKLDVAIAQIVFDNYVDILKKEVESSVASKSLYGGGDYYIEQVNTRIIQFCKEIGITNFRIGAIALALKDKTSHLERFAKEIPEAQKYINMI